jgi:serine/threonine protein kinase
MTEPRSRPEQIAEAEGAFDALVYEVAAKLESGEPVDLDALAVDHPEHVDRLRKLLPTLQAMAELGHADSALLAAPLESGRPGELKTGVLGDYRIIREIGRGGMGVVYEAEQVSLGRTVALKVLPFAAVLDPKHLKRFQNEARAAASLRIPGPDPKPPSRRSARPRARPTSVRLPRSGCRWPGRWITPTSRG